MDAGNSSTRTLWIAAAAIAAAILAPAAYAHAIGGKDAAFVAATIGPDPLPFMYLGAKHMVTGYDHLLFLLGVIFFLYRLKDVLLYVSLFSLGHSTTLLIGVLADINVRDVDGQDFESGADIEAAMKHNLRDGVR